MKRQNFVLFSILSSLALTSCSINFPVSSSSKTSGSTSIVDSSVYYPDGYYQDESGITNNINYKKINQSNDLDALPSSGDINILVIPVEFTDYPFTKAYESEAQLDDDFDRALNGNGSQDTQYWESLSSFYRKSSFNKLNLSFEIAPIYKTSYSTKSFASYANSSSSEATTTLLRNAVSDYKNTNGTTSTQKFDSDKDGLIDSVMLIYSCPSCYNDDSLTSLDPDASLFWSYCYWDYDQSTMANSRSPIGNGYFWCSYDFLYQVDECSIGNGVDSHVFCHETGHLLGLDDYYSYDNNLSSCFTGFADMMEGNYCDHDVFSKHALGWVSPYVVTGNCSISIKPSEINGDCIIIADDYNGLAFDEYLIMELYTPEELNYADSHQQYQPGYPICFTQAGIKLFHVDARLTTINNDDSGSYVDLKESSSLSFLKNYQVAATNSYSRDLGAASQKGYDLITMINADKKKSKYGNDAQLFQTGDTFSIQDYSTFFPKKTTFNNGDTFSYKITFNHVDEEGATITFEKIK